MGEVVDIVFLEVGNEVGVVGDDGEGVIGGDEGVSIVDYVVVIVIIGGGIKGDVVFIDDFDEGVGVG